MQNISVLDSFTVDSIPNLEVAVMGALELFADQKPTALDLNGFEHPLIVGSGNAEATGRIIFADRDALFASESDFEQKLNSNQAIDSVVLVSASGAKHAPVIARVAKKMGRKVALITNTADSEAEQQLDTSDEDKVFVYPKNREPYTYNTSTYMGMILAKTGEDPQRILECLQNGIEEIEWPDFSKYNKYYLIVPPEFNGIIRMLNVKFIELFGRNIARDIETSEYVRHATTVAPSDELFISFGEENDTWGKPENRLHIPMPDWTGYGAMMAIGYYTVSKIQEAHPDYFKENIEDYTKMVSEIFGSTITPIVEN